MTGYIGVVETHYEKDGKGIIDQRVLSTPEQWLMDWFTTNTNNGAVRISVEMQDGSTYVYSSFKAGL